MSSDTDASDLVAVFSDLYTGEYCNIAASALFIYEVLITLDREATCFWTSKQSKSGARLFFLANKWISVIVSAMMFAQMATFASDKRRDIPGTAIHSGLFSALRGYVLSKSKPIALLILVLSLTPLGVNMVQYGYNLQGVLFPPFGCAVTDETTASIQMKLLYISRVPLIVADALLVCITWSKLSSRDVLRGISWSKRLSLSDVLLRDGTIYFIVLFVMNILHVSLSLDALAIGADGASNISIFTAPITAILISRFLLQLQETDKQVVRVDFDDPLHSSRDPYDDVPSFISSLGAFINPDLLASPNDDADLDIHGSPHSDGEEEGGTHPSEPQATASSSASV